MTIRITEDTTSSSKTTVANETASTTPPPSDPSGTPIPAAPVTSTPTPTIAPDKPNPRLTLFWKSIVVALSTLGIAGTMNQVFFWELLGGGSLPTNSFLFLISACFLPIILIVHPLRKTGADTAKPGIPWYDILLGAAFIGAAIWLSAHGADISEYGWTMIAPVTAKILSVFYWLVVLEILRRCAGPIVAGLSLLVSIYPMFAADIPVGFLQGISYDPVTLAQVHVMGTESIHGLPLQTAATILVGFMLFGVALQHTGGAEFFNDLSRAIFGKYRGGSAKVSVASSAAMGMMSGSAVSNVLTTGPMTIPAMIRSGFTPKTAGAIEATASSGGSITPPIMGTAAFLMVSFLGIPYTEIIVAATIPAALYFMGIFLQVDGYAAIRKLHGEDRKLLPRVSQALRVGWPYVIALAILTGMLLTMPSEAQVPFYIVALLVGIAIIRPSVKFGGRELFNMMLDAGKSLGQIIAIIAGVGLILGGLSSTGVALSLSRDLLMLVGGNLILLLIAAALACFILGMGLTISAAYVFLAIVMVPAIIAMDVNPIAAHLFIIYWASISYITPPVGLAAFAAAGISKASPMATSFEAMRFGAVKYVVPFGFVLNPALVAQDSLQNIILSGLASIVAVFAISATFSGYLQFVEARVNIPLRIALGVGGFMMFLPQWSITLSGLSIIVAVAALAVVLKRRHRAHTSAEDAVLNQTDATPADITPADTTPETPTPTTENYPDNRG